MIWDTLPLPDPEGAASEAAPLSLLPDEQEAVDAPSLEADTAAPGGQGGAGHQALYRKWRSRSFEDVVGQGHVTRTLRNAVAGDTVGHAYLFTGARGTGKTSTARVLARAVNCLNPRDGEPCNVCTA